MGRLCDEKGNLLYPFDAEKPELDDIIDLMDIVDSFAEAVKTIWRSKSTDTGYPLLYHFSANRFDIGLRHGSLWIYPDKRFEDVFRFYFQTTMLQAWLTYSIVMEGSRKEAFIAMAGELIREFGYSKSTAQHIAVLDCYCNRIQDILEQDKIEPTDYRGILEDYLEGN